MARLEVVSYLRENLKKHPAEALRQQLAQEGVTDAEFKEALALAKLPPAGRGARALLVAGASLLAVAVLFYFTQKPAAPPPAPSAPAGASGESGFVGRHGFVVRLPKDYVAIQSFKDLEKTVEIVHFAKAGTDPTNFVDEGLFGPLGIVRLEVQPTAYAGYTNGLEALTMLLSSRARQRGEKFALKHFQVSSLHGVQFNYEPPFGRIESYILGQKVLYTFLTGQEDEIYRDILNSLRETSAEG
jgi:hypothetical protein